MSLRSISDYAEKALTVKVRAFFVGVVFAADDMYNKFGYWANNGTVKSTDCVLNLLSDIVTLPIQIKYTINYENSIFSEIWALPK